MSGILRLADHKTHEVTNRDHKWTEYELRKTALMRKNLSSRAYELEILRIAKELGI